MTQTVEQAITLPETLTEKEVNDYKAQHDCEVVLLQVADKKAWFRSPDIRIMSAANAQKSTTEFYKVIANNCIIAGTRDLITRDKYFIAIQSKLDQVINPFSVEVKNL